MVLKKKLFQAVLISREGKWGEDIISNLFTVWMSKTSFETLLKLLYWFRYLQTRHWFSHGNLIHKSTVSQKTQDVDNFFFVKVPMMNYCLEVLWNWGGFLQHLLTYSNERLWRRYYVLNFPILETEQKFGGLLESLETFCQSVVNWMTDCLLELVLACAEDLVWEHP